MAEKRYCKGSGKVYKFTDGNSILNLTVHPEQLMDYLAEINKQRAAEGEEPTKSLTLSVAKKKEPGKFGDTHYAYVRDYAPPKKKAPSKPAKESSDEDELPF